MQPRSGRLGAGRTRARWAATASATLGMAATVALARIRRRGAGEVRELPQGAVGVATEGYESGSPAERAAFNVLGSFTLTAAAARIVNYVRDQRRPLRPLRRLRNDSHVHHFVPGIAIAFVAGSASLLTSREALKPWLALPFGSGMALTVDEAALLLKLEDRYWSSERVALAQTMLGLAGAVGLAARFARRGERRALPGG